MVYDEKCRVTLIDGFKFRFHHTIRNEIQRLKCQDLNFQKINSIT